MCSKCGSYFEQELTSGIQGGTVRVMCLNCGFVSYNRSPKFLDEKGGEELIVLIFFSLVFLVTLAIVFLR